MGKGFTWYQTVMMLTTDDGSDVGNNSHSLVQYNHTRTIPGLQATKVYLPFMMAATTLVVKMAPMFMACLVH
jgi:hypothetical protein